MDQTITTKKTANGVTKKRSGRAADDASDANSPVELQNLLQSLRAMRSGDFTVRMGVEQDGILGKIADTFNDIVAANERMAQQLERVGQVVGREGKTRHRVKFGISNGAWDEMESSVNTLIDDLLWPTKEVTTAIAAVAQGDLLQTVRLEVDGRPLKGEFLEAASIVNTMIKQLSVFTSEVTRVAREVGTEGKLGGQAQVREVTGVWKDLTESVNSMASNLTAQVRNIAEVTIAVADGDLSKKITVDVRGEILQLKEAINTMVDQLRSFASEVTRVAREVGTDGKLGGQAIVPGVAGTWKDLTDSVNAMCGNLTDQVRNIAQVTTAVARGDLSRKITVDVRGEILELKDTINTMVDQLNAFASEVTRVAREVGTEGKLGGQAAVPGVAGTWKDLTDSVNFMAGNLTAQVRNIAEVATAIAGGDLSKKITVNVSGEILQLKETVNTMVDQLNAFAGEVTRVAREVGTEGRLGGQANVLGVAGTWKDLTDSVNSMAGNLTGSGAKHRRGDDRRRQRRPVEEDHRRRARRNSRAQGHHQHHGGPAQRICRRSDARRPRSRHRRQARRPGGGARRGRHLEGSDRLGELDGLEPHRSGAQHRRSRDRRGAGRPVEKDHRERVRRNPSAEGNAQHDGGPAQRLRLRSDARCARSRHRRQAGRPGRGAGRCRHLEGFDRLGELDGRQPHRPGSQHRRSGDGNRRRRSLTQNHRRCARRNSSAEGNAQHDGGPAQPVRRRSDARRARSRNRRPARRPGQRAGRRRHLEGLDRLGEFDGGQPHRPGPQHRRSHHRRGARRPFAQDHGGCERRNSRTQEHHQHHGGPAQRIRRRSDARRPRSRHRRQARWSGASAGSGRHLEGPDRQRQLHGRRT